MEQTRDIIVHKILSKKILFSSVIFEIDNELISVEHAITYRQIEKAMSGDTKAYIAIMDNAYLPHVKEVINSLKADMPILMNWTDQSVKIPDESKDLSDVKKLSRVRQRKAEIRNNKENN